MTEVAEVEPEEVADLTEEVADLTEEVVEVAEELHVVVPSSLKLSSVKASARCFEILQPYFEHK